MKQFFYWYASLIDRLPVPERSGCKGAILAVAFLFSFVNNFGGMGDIFCGMHPSSCEVEVKSVSISQRWRMLERVQFGKGKSRRDCECHLDFRFPGELVDREEPWNLSNGVRCGTVHDFPENYWVAMGDALYDIGPWKIGGWHGHPSDVRLHCSDDPKYTVTYLSVPVPD